jgi:hypothetical protein
MKVLDEPGLGSWPSLATTQLQVTSSLFLFPHLYNGYTVHLRQW